eukprot:Gb_41437 [translate_table: standard]
MTTTVFDLEARIELDREGDQMGGRLVEMVVGREIDGESEQWESVRVSNELGAGNFQAAKFAVIVSVTTSFVIGLVICSIIFFLREDLASLFTHSFTVKLAVSRLSILLAFTILLNSVQPVLSGAAIGTGRQAVIAYVNIGCYYLVGVPLGVVLGYVVDLGVMGMWTGMICGAAVANATKRIKTRSSQPSEIDRPLIHGSETIEQRN